ncbi:motility-associated protein [Planctomicrobium sp. SH664]|uniref:motility-associated protein n=1 Tax=Planctomicrobium sp. SH664 TaxID=3448125 RepID=UPI003F5CB2EC
MIVCFGLVIVIGAVLAGFSMAGGHVHSLLHPSELVTIGGAALGAMIASNPKKVLTDVVKHTLGLLKGSSCDRKMYYEVFTLLYEFFRVGRRDGLLAWEAMLSEPESNPVFQRCPRLTKDHHLSEFITGALVAAGEGSDAPQLQDLLDTEIQVMVQEHHAAVGALTRTADALPGFGIVAAVLGIVVTMQAINGPVEVIGHKVGAALVGTFLGILLSYGVIGPIAGRLESQGHEEETMRRIIASAIVSFVEGAPPKAVIEKARRGVPTDARPTLPELEEIFKGGASVAVAA